MDMMKKSLRPIYVPVANVYFKLFKAPKRYNNLFTIIRETKSKSILEIGTWNGGRAVEMIQVASESNSVSEILYYGFDLFEGLDEDTYITEISKRPPTKEYVTKLLSKTGAQINLYKGDTMETMPSVVPFLPKIDFIFIDGGHSVETVQSDWDAVSKLMHDNTVVIFDDYWRNRKDESAGPVVDAIDKHEYNVEILPEIDKFDNPDFGRLEISFAKVTKIKKIS